MKAMNFLPWRKMELITNKAKSVVSEKYFLFKLPNKCVYMHLKLPYHC